MSKTSYRQMTGPDGLIANRSQFEGNSMYARWVGPGYWPGSGRLDAIEREALEDAVARSQDTGKRMYVVYSYATPVAWALDGEPAYCTPQRFSVTTSKGQNYVRAWINHYVAASDTVSDGYATYRAERERLGI